MADYYPAGEWEPGIPLYSCAACTFETVEEDIMITHAEKAHPRERAAAVKILGPDGEEIPSIPVPQESSKDDEKESKDGDDDKDDDAPTTWRERLSLS